MGRKIFGRERRRCLQRRRPASSSTTTSTSTSALLYLAGSALDAPSLVQLAVDEEFLEIEASYLTDAFVERILSSAVATSSSSSSFTSSNFPSSVVGIFDTADLATAGDVLHFLLHHSVSRRRELKKDKQATYELVEASELIFFLTLPHTLTARNCRRGLVRRFRHPATRESDCEKRRAPSRCTGDSSGSPRRARGVAQRRQGPLLLRRGAPRGLLGAHPRCRRRRPLALLAARRGRSGPRVGGPETPPSAEAAVPSGADRCRGAGDPRSRQRKAPLRLLLCRGRRWGRRWRRGDREICSSIGGGSNCSSSERSRARDRKDQANSRAPGALRRGRGFPSRRASHGCVERRKSRRERRGPSDRRSRALPLRADGSRARRVRKATRSRSFGSRGEGRRGGRGEEEVNEKNISLCM